MAPAGRSRSLCLTRRRMGHSARSRTEIRRILHGRQFRGRARLDRRCARRSASARTPTCRIGRGCKACCAICTAASNSSIRARGRAATSRIITISMAGSIRFSSMPTGNIAAPISNTPDQSLDDAQLAKKRHLAAKLRLSPKPQADKPGAAFAHSRYRLRLGRAGLVSRRSRRRRCHRRNACRRNSTASPMRAQRKKA